MKMLKNKTVEVVEDPKPEPEPEVELVALQGEIFPEPMKVVELPIETLVDQSLL